MQPYFCAYIGYYQLIAAADVFVIYDNIKYTRRGWFNRNKILLNGREHLFTIPLRSGSDKLSVREREIADQVINERRKILARIRAGYAQAPYFNELYPFIESLFLCEERNLFAFIHHSVEALCALLDIQTPIVVSSTLPIDHHLKAEAKVLAICQQLDAGMYVNAIGGKVLYNKEVFCRLGVDLKFLATRTIEYPQLNGPFIPSLSIIDVLMFNGTERTKELLLEFDLETP